MTSLLVLLNFAAVFKENIYFLFAYLGSFLFETVGLLGWAKAHSETSILFFLGGILFFFRQAPISPSPIALLSCGGAHGLAARALQGDPSPLPRKLDSSSSLPASGGGAASARREEDPSVSDLA